MRIPALLALGVLGSGGSAAAADGRLQPHDRRLAILISFTPGMGAMYLGHPARGLANLGLAVIGGGVGMSGVNRQDDGRAVIGGAIFGVAAAWSIIDGATLPLKEEMRAPDPITSWRPDSPAARLSRPLRDICPSPEVKTFIRTTRAGLQEVIPDCHVNIVRNDGTELVNVRILSATDDELVYDYDDDKPLRLPTAEIAEIRR